MSYGQTLKAPASVNGGGHHRGRRLRSSRSRDGRNRCMMAMYPLIRPGQVLQECEGKERVWRLRQQGTSGKEIPARW